MKLNTQNTKRKAGMTLLELTVVILVLLSLISILFVGARAWKKGSDRSANIMNIRNCQQAMRGEQNMKQLLAGDAFTQTQLESYIKFPSDVNSAITYTAGTEITGESIPTDPNDPTVGDFSHIWLGVTLDGQPGGEYGHTSFDDISGW